jgi:hypothetical protein
MQKEREDWTMAEESKPVEVSRRIEAPAALIFKILANPQRHVDFDGSGMIRGAVLDRSRQRPAKLLAEPATFRAWSL